MLMLRPWPLLCRLGSFNLLTSLLLFFKYGEKYNFFGNLYLLTRVVFFWWVAYRGEFNLEGKASFVLESGVKFRIILFISSEVFFFFSFFWAYFQYYLSPTLEVGMSWPPVGIEVFDFSNIPLINTLVLMGSGLTVTISHYFLINNNMKLSNFWLAATLLLGMFFTYLQVEEYCRAFFSINDGNFGTSFFLLTGFHGLHVCIGSTFLLIVLLRSRFLRSSSRNFLRFELASWYWHFVDVVWIFLYFFLYYLNY